MLVVIDGAKALSAAVRGGVRPPGHRPLPTAQDPQRESKLPEALGLDRGQEDARRLPQTTPWPPRPSWKTSPASWPRPIPGPPGRSARASPRPSPSTASACRPPSPARCASTNAIESMIEICRDHSTNVKRWRDGQMALRWCAAGMVEAAKQFRKVNGFLHLPALRKALDAEVARITVTHAGVRSRSGLKATGPSPKFHGAGTSSRVLGPSPIEVPVRLGGGPSGRSSRSRDLR